MVEDLNTEPYLVDTALNHLIRAGKLDNAAGFVFGTDVNLKAQTIPDEVGVEPLDRGDPRRADRSAGDPRDRKRPRRAWQAHGDDAARRHRPRWTAPARRLRFSRRRWSQERTNQEESEVMRSRSMWTRTGLLVAVVAVAAAVVALPAGAQDSGSGEKKVLKIGWGAGPPDAQPVRRAWTRRPSPSGRSTGTCWSTSAPRTSRPTPGIAESWEVSDDEKTRHLHARPTRNWSDGEPITSTDVKYSLETLGADGLTSSRATPTTSPSIKTPDDATVVIKTSHPTPASSAASSSTCSPSTSGARSRSTRSLARYQPELPMVGSGPYVVTEFERGRILRMERNPEWTGEAARASTRSSSSSTAPRTPSSAR